jgi:hypothetical protein
MDIDTLFKIANVVALVGWIVLAAAPIRRGLAVTLARSVAIGLALAYAVLLVRDITDGGLGGDLTTLSGLAEGLSQPEALLVGWVHYLAFDLWVGAWIVEDAGRSKKPHGNVPHFLVLLALFLTLLAGPVGLLVYLLFRIAPVGLHPYRG